jgi:cellulose synthase operon protein B
MPLVSLYSTLSFFSVAMAQAPELAVEPPAAAPAIDQVMSVRFDQELLVQTDLMLQGLESHQTLTFTVPRAWELTDDPLIDVQFDHSAALDPSRSSLTIQVNDQALGSVKLDAGNVLAGRIQVRVPRRLLVDYNKLKLTVVQHLDEECEDPFDPALWSRVSKASRIDLAYRSREVVGELADFPYPLFDELGYGPAELTLVGTGAVGAVELEALGLLGQSMGRHAGYRTVTTLEPVADIGSLQSNGLILGVASKTPVVEQLLGLQPLAAGQGLVALVPAPGNPQLAILVVTGGDEAGVLKAAQALASQDRYQLLSGASAKVVSVEDAYPPKTQRDVLPVPFQQQTVTLAELGMKEATVRGFYSESVRIPLMMEGDAHLQEDQASFDLVYSYGAQLDPRLSTVEVRVGGIVLRSAALDQAGGAQQAHLKVALPAEMVEPHSQVEVIFHLFPIDFDPCRRVSDEQIWATIHTNSKFDLPRYYAAMLPSLDLLNFDLWPFAQAPAAGGLTILVDDKPSWGDATAAVQAAAEHGRLDVSARPDLQVRAATKGGIDKLKDRHLLVLVGDGGNSAFDDLAATGRVTLEGKLDRALSDGAGAKLMAAAGGSAFGVIEEILRPGEPARLALVMRTHTDNELAALVQTLRDPSRLVNLSGNAAVLPTSGGLRTLDVAKKQQVGKVPVASRASIAVRRSWFIIAGAVIVCAFAIAAVVRGWARSRGGVA